MHHFRDFFLLALTWLLTLNIGVKESLACAASIATIVSAGITIIYTIRKHRKP